MSKSVGFNPEALSIKMPAMRRTDTVQALVIFPGQALLELDASDQLAIIPALVGYQVVGTGSIEGGTVRRYTNRYNPRELSLFVGRQQESGVVVPNGLAHVFADIGVTIEDAMNGSG